MHRWMKWVSIVFLGCACAAGCNNPIGDANAPQAPSNGGSGGSAGGAGSAGDGGPDVQSEAMPDASDVSVSDAASDTDGGSSGAGGSDGSSGGSSGGGGIGGGFADAESGAGGASGTDGGTGGQGGGGGIAGGGAGGSAGSAGSDAYTQITYTFVTPGGMVKDHIAIWHEADDANGNALPRTPPYGPCSVMLIGQAFVWSEAWDCNSNKCEFNQKSQIVCTVHVPKSSVVRADVHFYNQGADGGWSCTSMTGPSQGIIAATGGSKNLPLPLTKEDYPLPNTGCRFKFTAPAD